MLQAPKVPEESFFPIGFLPGKKFCSTEFVIYLLNWYNHHKRWLPWRITHDPYKIWLSEVILQQTRVDQALPYYKKFVQAFPDVETLSNASEKEVLCLWQGLGYYGRARRLHACSKHITRHLNGDFPTTYDTLIKLPGIGPYTAAAIASIAFDEQVPVLDGNVYRVLARLFGLHDPVNSSQNKVFYQLARRLMPNHSPSTYNQAIMEFGALVCTPRKPGCSTCPFQPFCYAYHTDRQLSLPVKKRSVTIRKRYFYYLIIHFNQSIYLKKRVHNDIWLRLYDFYLIEEKKDRLPFHRLQNDVLLDLIKQHRLQVKKSSYTTTHQLTHQHLHTCFFHVYASEPFIKQAADHLQKTGMQPYVRLAELPMPVLIQRFCAKDLPPYHSE